MDYVKYVSERITKLRTSKGVSARDMSISMGQNVNYVNNIENRKAEPSLSGFFIILEYFGVSPQEFFDTGNTNPVQLNDFIEDVKQLDDSELFHLSHFMKEIVSNRK